MFACTEKFRFAEFTLSPAKRTLFRERTEIKLRDKDFDVLSFLIESAPKTCSHDEIIETVWNGTFVESASVDKSIANIRKILGDNVRSPRFIKTIRSKGYLFVGDVEKTKENTTENREAVRQYKDKSAGQGKLFLYIRVIFLLGILGLIWWKGGKLWARYNSTVIFADDFSSGELDPNRWKIKGNTARVENGIAKIIIAETDKGAKLESALFSFEPNKAITINCRIKISYSQNFKDKVYFNAHFGILPKTSFLHLADEGIKNHLMFGVKYTNYDYESKYSNGEIDELKTEGFFLIRDNGAPFKKIDYRDGKISKRIEPVWNEWFEQKLVYEPFSGKMSYFINDELKDVINVGDLSNIMEENKLRLDINPSGWWVNHSIELDYIEITQ